LVVVVTVVLGVVGVVVVGDDAGVGAVVVGGGAEDVAGGCTVRSEPAMTLTSAPLAGVPSAMTTVPDSDANTRSAS
jgi:preprotein translocase subunit SecG